MDTNGKNTNPFNDINNPARAFLSAGNDDNTAQQEQSTVGNGIWKKLPRKPEPKTNRISIMLRPSTAERLLRLSERLKISRTEIVNIAIENLLDLSEKE